MGNDDKMLSERIQAALAARGMKQADLARETGLSTALIAQITTGQTSNPQFRHVVAISKALDVTLDYLAGYEEL